MEVSKSQLATLGQRLESLCRELAPLDLADSPLYIVWQGNLPADHGQAKSCHGCTAPSLDLWVKSHIENYAGRGPCMLINDIAMGEDLPSMEAFESRATDTVVHELAHILDREQLYADRAGVSEDRITFERLVVFKDLDEAPPETPPDNLWLGHGAPFIRLACHLAYRAQQLGFEIVPADLCAGYRYGLYPAIEYARALGDEPERMIDSSFAEIRATEQPHRFGKLWLLGTCKNLSPEDKQWLRS